MSGSVQALYRYPVKGLSAERLEIVQLETGKAIAQDRRFAIAHGATWQPDRGSSNWLPKGRFLQLMSHEKLAALETRFDQESGVLTVLRHGRPVSRGNITDITGQAILEQFFSAYMGREIRGAPKIIECGEQPFSDARAPFISLINLASVRDLERVVGRAVDPMRFRANILLDGIPAWQEFDWVGKSLKLGEASLQVEERTGRCAATNVEPGSGQRDMTLPRNMQRAYGHDDCGVYARVTASGTAAIGAAVTRITET